MLAVSAFFGLVGPIEMLIVLAVVILLFLGRFRQTRSTLRRSLQDPMNRQQWIAWQTRVHQQMLAEQKHRGEKRPYPHIVAQIAICILIVLLVVGRLVDWW